MARIVMAVGGNALEPRAAPGSEGSGESGRTGGRRAKIATAVDAVAALETHELVLTHGNGPQVGRLALQSELTGGDDTLDVLGAETEGMMGYAIERAIRSRLPSRPVVTLLTQVEVDADDPAFDRPTKPIGPTYERDRAEDLARTRGWTVGRDGEGWRRVVPSPIPRRILELEAIRLLLDSGQIVICGGGGGIPVVVGPDGAVDGVEAVVDKDRSSALLASGVGADVLLLLTDESAIFRDWPDRQDPIREVTPDELRELDLAEGSMGPKAEAAATFVESGGGVAVIGAMSDAEAMLAGEAGTRVTLRRDP